MRPADSDESDRRRDAFANLPGTHVQVRSLGGTKREYVRGDGTVLAAPRTRWRKNPLYPNPQVTVDGRVFEERLLGKRRNNHMRSPREVVELETGNRLFRIDGLNFNGSVNAVIRFSESRGYTFPVEGTRQRYSRVSKPGKRIGYPVMSAIRRFAACGPSVHGTPSTRGWGDCHCSGPADHVRTSGDDGNRVTLSCILLRETWRLMRNRRQLQCAST